MDKEESKKVKNPEIHIQVKTTPPVYDSGLSISNPGHSRHSLYLQLREKAKEEMMRHEKFRRDIELEMQVIVYRTAPRPRNYPDSMNILGGIVNTLENIVYENDAQITSIRYHEEYSRENWYEIIIRKQRED